MESYTDIPTLKSLIVKGVADVKIEVTRLLYGGRQLQDGTLLKHGVQVTKQCSGHWHGSL